jgi:hypothetical protein
MPNYAAKALQQFQHQQPRKPEHAPHKHINPQYGATIQYTELEDTSPPLNAAKINLLQQVIGTWNTMK